LKKDLPKFEEKFEAFKKKVSDLHKEATYFHKWFRLLAIQEYFVVAFLVVAVILGVVGLDLYPKGAPEAYAVKWLYGSALIMGLSGIIISLLSIIYGSLGMKLSFFLLEYQGVINNKDELERLLEGIKGSVSSEKR